MAMTLITPNTSSNAATSDFTSSIDNTYKLYIFKFYDVNPVTDNVKFTFQGSIDGGSNYNVTATTTAFSAQHEPSGGESTTLTYMTAEDLAQGTGFQTLAWGLGNGSDETCAGELFLFNPSNTTFVKHFYATSAQDYYSSYVVHNFFSGYFNNTNDIDAVQFKMSSGNMDAVIKMYGVG